MADQRKMITTEPENSETPLESQRSWVTPNRLFFVRNHFDVPRINPDDWRLKIEGMVDKPTSWTYDELMALPERTVFATVECAGNGRSFLRQKVEGVQWGAGAIGHAEWTGVPVRIVLERAGINPKAIEVLFEGLDQGTESDHPETMNFARSLPLDKALHQDTLLVFQMNGELLEPNHGFPVRLFVPGWYGVASVKWLHRIEVLEKSFHGYFQNKKYVVQRPAACGTRTVIVREMVPKSEIVQPKPGTVLGVGTNRIFGIAWAGEQAVARVDISTDGGTTWNQAEMVGPRAGYSWTMWEYLWEVVKPGDYSLLAKATTEDGQTQPLEHDPLLAGYMINACRAITVRIDDTRRSRASWSDLDTLYYDMNAFAEERSRLPLDVELEFVGGEGI